MTPAVAASLLFLTLLAILQVLLLYVALWGKL